LIIDDPAENATWVAKWQARPKEAIRQAFDCLHGREDLEPRLDEITCPALVVHGTEDHAIEMVKAEALAAGLSGCDGVVKVAGAHAANLTNPVPVNTAIRTFLAGLPA
jgi:3-oxoadipate enol-lactonase